jgi:hypothetical protein
VGPGGNLDGIVESFSASNLDDALDMLEVVNAKTDKASVGNMASGIEKHPEVPSRLPSFTLFDALTDPVICRSVDSRHLSRHIANASYRS